MTAFLRSLSLLLTLGFALSTTQAGRAEDATATPAPAAPVYDAVKFQKANAAIQADPKDRDAYLLRGNIYAQRQMWAESRKDYETAIGIDPVNPVARINLGEIEFKQKQYDQAKADFIKLQGDSEYGDLANYKVFLCNLLGGHEADATAELKAFNDVGSNPSYYFSNIAWSVNHHQIEEARGFMDSALRIYSPFKIALYGASLKDLGYLPLPPK